MGKVYTNQEFTLYVHTGTDLTNCSTVQIQGTEPDGSSMTNRSGDIVDRTKGLVSLTVLDTYFTTSGVWVLWAHVNYTGGDEAWGEPFFLYIHESGS